MNRDAALSCVNPRIRALAAYHLVPDQADVKLNQNENPFDWPAEIKEEAAAFVRGRPWNRYPDFVPAALKAALASWAGVSERNVIVGNGSNEMLLVVMLGLTDADRPLLTCQPTFTVYRLLAKGMGRDCEPVYLDGDFRFDTRALCEASAKNPRAVMLLCSPNNPTGSALSKEQIRAVLACHQGFIVLDQAYVEFGGYNAVELIGEYPNLIVTRTFSKAFGAAGLRLGYMIGNEDVIAELNKIKLPYNINFFSDYTAMLLLSRPDMVRERVGVIIRERGRVLDFLRSLAGVTAYDSEANFILIRTPDSSALMRGLRQDNILVRDVSSYPMLENCVRISIGAAGENDRLMAGMRKIFKPRA